MESQGTSRAESTNDDVEGNVIPAMLGRSQNCLRFSDRVPFEMLEIEKIFFTGRDLLPKIAVKR